LNWLQWIPKGWAVLIAISAVAMTMVLMFLWFVLAIHFHRRFQFSIWSLLLLTLAVAISSSWLAMELNLAKSQQDASWALFKLRGIIDYDYKDRGPFWRDLGQRGPIKIQKKLVDDFFGSVTDVHLSGTKVTDDDLKHLEGMKHLKTLDLSETYITDAGLEHLGGLKQLRRLVLWHTQTTDAGVAKLQVALPNLYIDR
jgi:hypothetical protein